MKRADPVTFVMETGTHSPWVSRLLEAFGHTVHVGNARKLRAISTSATQSDQEDARGRKNGVRPWGLGLAGKQNSFRHDQHAHFSIDGSSGW